MKKNALQNFVWGACFICLMAACGDDDNDYSGPNPDKVTATYSNELSMPEGGNLVLTYSGQEFIGKTVVFQTTDGKTAEMILANVLPGEPQTTISNIPLTGTGDTYTFSGTGTGLRGTTFKYEGKVNKEKLYMNLTEVKIADPVLNGKWALVQNATESGKTVVEEDGKRHRYTPYHQTLYMNTDHAGLSTLETIFANMLVGPLLKSVLKDISFSADGNITASYAPLPETFDFKKDIIDNNGIIREDGDWLTSPFNLATYYVENTTDLYVIPHLDMIVRQTQQDADASPTRTANTPADPITQALAQVSKWLTTGIHLTMKENPRKEYFIYKESNTMVQHRKYEGDYIVYIDKEEIQPLLPAIEMLIPLLLTPELVEQLKQETGGFLDVKVLIDIILEAVKNANTLEIGLYLNKVN